MTANPMPPMIPMSGPSGPLSPHGASRFKAVDPLRVVRIHLWWLVGSLVAGLMIGVGTWVALRMFVPRYTSMMQLRVHEGVVDPNQPIAGGMMQSNKAVVEMRVANEVAKLMSEEILRAALERPEVRATSWYKNFTNNRTALESLAEDVLRVYPASGTSLINVAVRTPSARDPHVILDAIISVYLFRLNEEATTNTGDTRQVYVNESRQWESEISRLAAKLDAFTREHRITSTEVRFNEETQMVSTYTQEIAKLVMNLDSATETHRMLVERQQAGDQTASPEDLAAINSLPEVSMVQSRLDMTRENHVAAVLTWGENSHAARSLVTRIAGIEQELELKRKAKLLELQSSRIEGFANSIGMLQAQINSLVSKRAETQARLTDLQQRLAEYQRIRDDLKLAQDNKARNDAMLGDIRVITQRPDSKTVQRYTASTEPEMTFPRATIIIPGVTLLIVGLTTGIIFLVEMLDQRVKAPADLKLIPDAEMIGILPDASEDHSSPTGVERVVEKYPAGLMAEAYRAVRTAVTGKMDRRGYKTLMVAAAQPRSGTSCLTQNLATSLAFHGRNVAIIDANFRRPSQHRLFDLPNDQGLADILRDRATLDQCLRKIEGLNISVLTTGPAADAPPELLEGSILRNLITEMEGRFDLVLVDAPPALLTSDAQVLAKHVDAVVAVVRAVQDKRGMVERMMRRLGGQRADLLGIVLNGVQSSVGGYFRESYRQFYRYRENGHDAGSIDRPAPARKRAARKR